MLLLLLLLLQFIYILSSYGIDIFKLVIQSKSWHLPLPKLPGYHWPAFFPRIFLSNIEAVQSTALWQLTIDVAVCMWVNPAKVYVEPWQQAFTDCRGTLEGSHCIYTGFNLNLWFLSSIANVQRQSDVVQNNAEHYGICWGICFWSTGWYY